MENKIFVVLATVALSFFVRSSAAAVLPDSAIANFREIKTIELAVLGDQSEAFNALIDIIEKRLALLIANATATSDDEATEAAAALAQSKATINSTFDAIRLATGVSSDTVSDALSAANANAEDGFVVVAEALTIAASSSASEDNASEIETYRTETQEYFSELIANVFDAITSSVSNSSTDFTDIIAVAEKKSKLATAQYTNALFNVIRVYHAAVVAGSAAYSDLKSVESYRNNIKLALEDESASKFALLRTIYICFNHDGNTLSQADLYEVAYSHSSASNKYEDSMNAVFATIKAYSSNVSLGLSAVRPDEFASKDVQKLTAFTKWVTGTHEIMVAALPDDSSAVETPAEAYLAKLTFVVAEYYFQEIELARTVVSDASEPIANIASLNTEVKTGSATYLAYIVDIMTRSYDVSDEVHEKITTLQTSATTAFETMADSIANATTLLAEGASAGETTDLLTKVSTLQAATVAAARLVSDILTYIRLLLIAYN